MGDSAPGHAGESTGDSALRRAARAPANARVGGLTTAACQRRPRLLIAPLLPGARRTHRRELRGAPMRALPFESADLLRATTSPTPTRSLGYLMGA